MARKKEKTLQYQLFENVVASLLLLTVGPTIAVFLSTMPTLFVNFLNLSLLITFTFFHAKKYFDNFFDWMRKKYKNFQEQLLCSWGNLIHSLQKRRIEGFTPVNLLKDLYRSAIFFALSFFALLGFLILSWKILLIAHTMLGTSFLTNALIFLNYLNTQCLIKSFEQTWSFFSSNSSWLNVDNKIHWTAFLKSPKAVFKSLFLKTSAYLLKFSLALFFIGGTFLGSHCVKTGLFRQTKLPLKQAASNPFFTNMLIMTANHALVSMFSQTEKKEQSTTDNHRTHRT